MPKILADDNRPKWDNKIQYILSCIGFAVGLGNVWRFPYLCQAYGGGAFLIPYFIALVLVGIPLFHLELAIGQRLRKGSIGVWTAMSPYLGGIGYSSLMVSLLVSMYYNMILTWVLWYFMNSVQVPLPWSSCPLNDNRTGPVEECHESTAANYFWYRKTLNITTDITESGSLQWWLILCLATCWTVVYICTIRGIESTGKAIYVTATFPYVVLTIFLIYGFTLPGAIEGLFYLITPDLNILKNPRVWLDAATQIFFSLSLGFGGHIAYSSYNSPKNDCEVDAIIIAVVNSATSLYAAIPVFSVLGFKATMGYWNCLDRNIKDIINAFDLEEQSVTRGNYTIWVEALIRASPEKMADLALKNCDLHEFFDQSASGAGLAFMVFTEAVVQMPGSQAWALLFFIMLFTLGLSSMFGNIQSILTPLLEFPIVAKSMPKEAVSGIICLFCFLMGLCFTLRSGSYWLEVFDSYAGSLPLLIIAFFEVVGVAYVYGIKRFNDDVKWMIGRRPNFYWQVTWRFISPLLMLTVFVAYIVFQTQKQPGYGAWNPNYVGRFSSKRAESVSKLGLGHLCLIVNPTMDIHPYSSYLPSCKKQLEEEGEANATPL
ncbi:inactive sodium-dependent neutral amino acid transporter B(0)AT3 isoform X2 [Hemicordylus capensis]|uniref:inactive sodium-dependent neutral amino acid transporter B(0)AT3 isoform X2 n=1 Tax=Hemicordylus capensis TaxID=884348 RepID=UPI002302A680|nr:inactive sodium-dependent neutral amino acid transporter B(0)AT3 isoform X2 [Hemicordylus capensis]